MEGFALERCGLRDACARLQFLINIPEEWVWMVQQARTAKEMRAARRDHFQIESELKKSLALNKPGSAKFKEGQDIPAHVQRMGRFWQDVLTTKAPVPGGVDANQYFITTLLKSLLSSWSTSDSKKVPNCSSSSTVIGRILGLDALIRTEC